MPEEERDPRDVELGRLKNAVAILSQHFEAVQIFATAKDPADEKIYLTYNHGSGNWYSRYGLVREWITLEDERSRLRAREERP